MRRVVGYVLIAYLWVGVSRAEAQTLKLQAEVEKKLEQRRAEQKTALEQLIAEALKNNPDIRVGESKVRDAEAELQRTRMKVLSEITVLHAETQAAQAGVEEAARRFDRVQKLLGQKAISAEVLDEANQSLLKSKANLAVNQARLSYLLGKASLTASVRLHLANDLANALVDPFQTPKELPGHKGEVIKFLIKSTRGNAVSDEEFLRRITLDLLGRLPTAEETKDFMKSPDKERREKWVEKIQKTKELDHWLRVLPVDPKETVRYRDSLYAYYFSLANKSDSPMTDKLRKALDMPVRMLAKSMTPADILDHVRDTMLVGVNLHARVSKKGVVEIWLKEPLPLGAFLQFLEDELHVVFILRDYGVVVVDADERLPPGAISVIDFWKRGKLAEKPSQAKEKK